MTAPSTSYKSTFTVGIHNTTTPIIVQNLKSIFARWGIPVGLISNNGPPYSSQEFAKFLAEHSTTHITSSPCYRQSNGAAERAVQTAKRILAQPDPVIALITYRCSKTVTAYSPNQVMLGADIKTSLTKRDAPEPVDLQAILENDTFGKLAAKAQYDKSALN
ncbi:uncharacterized protein [Watersipora subatra]|uniref:uncharacterized protein n=1 Tax=Watersipora subatra TaxID=2589382 RepID=UPI00355B872F